MKKFVKYPKNIVAARRITSPTDDWGKLVAQFKRGVRPDGTFDLDAAGWAGDYFAEQSYLVEMDAPVWLDRASDVVNVMDADTDEIIRQIDFTDWVRDEAACLLESKSEDDFIRRLKKYYRSLSI